MRLGHTRDVHTQHAQGRARRHAHTHATGGNHLVTQIRPLSPAHAVLDHAERRLRLIVDHRVPRAQEATASILVVIRRQREPPVLVGPLLAHQVGDLLAHQRGVGRLDERGDATHVRGSNRRPRHIPVVRRDHQVRERRVDVPPRRGKIDAHEAIVGGIRSLQGRPERLLVRGRHLERTHHGDAPDHRGHHRGPLDVAILNRRRIGGRRTVHGRLVEVQAIVPSARQHGQSALLCSVDRAQRGLHARCLLGVVRLPEPPRVHLEGIVDDIDAVVHGPVVGAHEVLRVQAPLVVDGLNRHEGRVRRDTVDTNVVVVGGDDSGDVRAVDIVVTQRLLAHVGDSIDVAGHGPGRIDPTRQVGLLCVNTRVDDAHGDGRARHLHLGCAPRVHGLGPPVSGRERIRDVRVWHGQARGRRCWRRARGRRRSLVRHPLGLGDRGHASRADRVDRDAVLPQDRVQVRRERGRLTLSENSVQSGVLRQEGSPDAGEEFNDARHRVLVGELGEVDGVIHETRARSGGRDQAGGILSSGGRGGHRSDAHGQGDRCDNPYACNVAAHGSSTFTCACAWTTLSTRLP